MYLDPLLLSPLYMHECVCVCFIWIYGIFFIRYFYNLSKFGMSTRSHWLAGRYSNGIHMWRQFNRLPCLSFIVVATVVSVSVCLFVRLLGVICYCWLYANLHLTNKKVINSLVLHKSKSHIHTHIFNVYTAIHFVYYIGSNKSKL